jgi:FAD/FMN-containing dehydrogenase
MFLRPTSYQELQASLEEAARKGQRIHGVSLEHFSRVLEHYPEDLTVTVEAGLSLQSLQEALRKHRQWLPLDPAHPETTTIRSLLEENRSGPRRHGYGTVREHLIGLKAMLPDGQIIKSGGKVVKNVAGYDLQKLFVGSHSSLGMVLEATFKLQPLPEAEQFWEASFESLNEAFQFARKLLESPMEPVVLDLHHLRAHAYQVVFGFAGAREDVEWQNGLAEDMAPLQPFALGHDQEFWNNPQPAWKLSVLPTQLAEGLHLAGPEQFVARVGSGLAWCRGGTQPPKAALPLHWMRQLKDMFDPKHLLPELPL